MASELRRNHAAEAETSYLPRRRRALGSFVAFLVVAFLLLVIGWIWWSGSGQGIDPKAAPRAIAVRATAPPSLEVENIDIYQHGSPSLVQVTSLEEQGTLFGLNVQEVPQGVGSGFVWDTDGHIVTAYHVVQGASGAKVTLSDHSTYRTEEVWGFPDRDIAVLWIKVPKSKLHPVPVGTSHDLKVGQIVYAFGDPFGLDQTMTNGIVSALGREVESSNGRHIHGCIQTSAPINPGNSGGPLLDSAGRLIGMNTAILSPSGAFAGIGFAVPVDDINRFVPQLIAHGKIVRPHLGVQVAEDQLAEQLGVDSGALILKTLPNSAAAAAGLQGTRRDPSGEIHLGDVVIAVDDKPVKDAKDLSAAMESHKVGDKVNLTIMREGKREQVTVTLSAAS